MKYLFVCSANKQRSRTAEDHFYEKSPSDEFISAGTNHKICNQEGTTPLTEDLLQWADIVYVMEYKHRAIIMKNSKENYHNKIKVLNIQDRYKYGSADLIKLLDSKITL
jgi:predicted protein tyrosine phosphatase